MTHPLKPIRIQRRRTKGWKMPTNTVYVGRPTKWGNPFSTDGDLFPLIAVKLGERGDRQGCRKAAVRLHRAWLTGDLIDDLKAREKVKGLDVFSRSLFVVDAPTRLDIQDIRKQLRGKNLCCWCPLDQPCHADVLLEIANG